MITVKEMGSIMQKQYMGVSTDNKPTNCAPNSLFLELDTGKFYYFDGTDWLEIGATVIPQ